MTIIIVRHPQTILNANPKTQYNLVEQNPPISEYGYKQLAPLIIHLNNSYNITTIIHTGLSRTEIPALLLQQQNPQVKLQKIEKFQEMDLTHIYENYGQKCIDFFTDEILLSIMHNLDLPKKQIPQKLQALRSQYSKDECAQNLVKYTLIDYPKQISEAIEQLSSEVSIVEYAATVMFLHQGTVTFLGGICKLDTTPCQQNAAVENICEFPDDAFKDCVLPGNIDHSHDNLHEGL